MKIYNRKEFLKLPNGTVFCKGKKWFFDNLYIKVDTLGNDFSCINLCNIEAYDTAEWSDRLEDSLENGTSYPINKDSSRDGMFDDEDIFLVFESEDLKYLIGIMKIS